MFHHTFVCNDEIYATPYSACDVDFMDSAVVVCSADWSTIDHVRLSVLLSEILHYSNAVRLGIDKQWTGYKRHCLRRLYSLEVRLQKAVGQYACNAILLTLYALPLVKIETV